MIEAVDRKAQLALALNAIQMGIAIVRDMPSAKSQPTYERKTSFMQQALASEIYLSRMIDKPERGMRAELAVEAAWEKNR